MVDRKIYYGVGSVVIIVIYIMWSSKSVASEQFQVINSETSSNQRISEVENQKIYVQVRGSAVGKPGMYEMMSGDRINDILEAAQVTNYNSECINLAQKLVDEQNLNIPKSGEECSLDSAVSDDGVVNINTASAYELQTLSGIGETKATAIVEYRNQHGTFESKEDLLNVEGISEGLLKSISEDIRLS